MDEVFFTIAVVAQGIILILALCSLVFKQFDFFPPPSKQSWQYFVFWWLFRVMILGLLYLSFSTFNPGPIISLGFRYFVALPLLLIGFGFATYWSVYLGWKNAHGEKKGLIVSGIYQWSRNPIYVVSFFWLMGWALFIGSLYVAVILCMWSIFYVLAPFVEEPWMEKQYGDEYRQYKNSVGRFFSLPFKK